MTEIRERVARAMFDTDYEAACGYKKQMLDDLWIEFKEPTYRRLRHADAAMAAVLQDLEAPSEAAIQMGGNAFMSFYTELKERGVNHGEELDAARCAFAEAWHIKLSQYRKEQSQ